MKRVLAGLACVAALAAAIPAMAQSWDDRDRGGRGGVVELYSEPGFQGERRTFTTDWGNMAEAGFNDRAQSVRIRGRGDVQVCADSDFRGRCIVLRGDEPDLNRLGFGRMISSLRRAQGDWDRAGGRNDDWGRGRDDWSRGGGERADATGRTASFFARPSLRGEPLSTSCGGSGWGGGACVRDAADQFCRRQGFRGSAYASSGRSSYGEALEDVLCVR